jgi:hypothetical protein
MEVFFMTGLWHEGQPVCQAGTGCISQLVGHLDIWLSRPFVFFGSAVADNSREG